MQRPQRRHAGAWLCVSRLFLTSQPINIPFIYIQRRQRSLCVLADIKNPFICVELAMIPHQAESWDLDLASIRRDSKALIIDVREVCVPGGGGA